MSFASRALCVLACTAFSAGARGETGARDTRPLDEQFVLWFQEGGYYVDHYIISDGMGTPRAYYTYRAITQHPGECTSLFFRNDSDDVLTLTNGLSPDGGAPLRPTVMVAPGVNIEFEFCCVADEGEWKFRFTGPNARPVDLWLDVKCLGSGCLKLNELDYDPANAPEDPAEFIELFNCGASIVYLDGLVLSDEGNSGTAEATFAFPGNLGGTTLPVQAGDYVVIVGDATDSTVPSIDFEFYGGPPDSDHPGVPNLIRTAGSAADVFLGNTGDGITLSNGTSRGLVIPCPEILDGVGWEGGGSSDVVALDPFVCSDPATHPGYTNGGPSGTLSLQRWEDGFDTNESAADFVAVARTPGATNGAGAIPPNISNVHTEACFVGAGQPNAILASIVDPNIDITSVRVFHRLSGAAPFDSVAAAEVVPDLARALLPGRPDQAEVQYYIEARDAAGNIVREPGGAPAVVRSYRVGLQTITSLQVPMVVDGCAASSQVGRAVNVTGVVTHRAYEFSDNTFYVQQGNAPRSGIKVFTATDSAFVPDLGDSVLVSGVVDEFNCQTEIVLFQACGTVLATNHPVPLRTLASVSQFGHEDNESMLVSVPGPIPVLSGFDNTNLGQEFKVGQASNVAYVGDDTFFPDGIGYTPIPVPGMVLDALTGIVGYRRTDSVPPRADPTVVLRLEPRRDNDVDRDVTDVGGDGVDVVRVFRLGRNVPNPFNPSTTIEFSVQRAGPVQVWIFDSKGQLVRTLPRVVPEGAWAQRVEWNGRDERGILVGSGVYYYRLESDGKTATRKMLLLK